MDTMQQHMREIYKELALIEDEKKREEQKHRVEMMLMQYDEEDKVILSNEYMEKVSLEKSLEQPRMMTGIQSLDEALNGFKKTDLVVISAPTGVGKTTYCQTLIENFYDQGIQSLLISYEVAPEELVFSKDIIYSLPAMLKGDTLEWIEKKIIEAKVKHNVQAVFIDHLHYISDVSQLGKGQNMSTVIGVVMSKLAKMAKQWNVAIFLVCHLKKTRFDEMPDMSELRDSSFIAQYADIVMMLIRKMEEVIIDGEPFKQAGNTTIVSIQKARGTGRKLNTFKLQYENNKLVEYI